MRWWWWWRKRTPPPLRLPAPIGPFLASVCVATIMRKTISECRMAPAPKMNFMLIFDLLGQKPTWHHMSVAEIFSHAHPLSLFFFIMPPSPPQWILIVSAQCDCNLGRTGFPTVASHLMIRRLFFRSPLSHFLVHVRRPPRSRSVDETRGFFIYLFLQAKSVRPVSR